MRIKTALIILGVALLAAAESFAETPNLQEPIVYTQGVSISGRLRLAELDPSASSSVSDVASVVEPFVSGAIDPFGDSPQTPKLAGVIWGDELANLTSDNRYAAEDPTKIENSDLEKLAKEAIKKFKSL